MTEPLFDHLAQIAGSLRDTTYVLLFLDFDGTLAPIHQNPGAASMPRASRRALKALEASGRSTVAIISGRALPDLRERVRMEEIIFAGNHGLEITGPGLHFVEPTAARRVEALEELARHLQVRLRHIPGVEVENKVLTVSVHVRRAPVDALEEIQKALDAAATPAAGLFQVTVGLQVFEIRPRVNWNKGLAVLWIKAALKKRDALTLYIGDDMTDEDAFTALPDGLTISVGRTSDTCARYHVETQESVQEFLQWLAGHIGDRNHGFPTSIPQYRA